MKKLFNKILPILFIILMLTNSIVYAGNNEYTRLRNEIRRVHNNYNKTNIKKIPILAYHHVIKREDIIKNNQEHNEAILALEEFHKQMKYLYDNNFYVASLNELEDYLNGSINLPPKTVILTFDDGYLSNKEYCYEIMKNYNFRGSIFLITSLLDKPSQSFNEQKIQFLRKDDLLGMEDVFDFHSHTHDMHRGVENDRSLLVSSNKDAVYKDLLKSKELLKTKYLAYPSGNNSPLVIKELKNLDYKLAFTIAPGYVSKNSNRYKIPRFSVSSQTMSFEKFKDIVNQKLR